MVVYAVDPGSEQSAIVSYARTGNERRVRFHMIAPNDDVLEYIRRENVGLFSDGTLAIEEFVSSFGMAVGREVFATVWWSGRFYEAWNGKRIMVPRKTAVTHICGVARANDSNVRTEILDRFGGKLRAIGRKSDPGPLYGLKGHEFAALAIALTVTESPTYGKETGNTETEAQTLAGERAV